MADDRNKNENQSKQQQPMNKPQRPKDLDKDVGNENRKIQKDLETDETDEGESLDEQGEITQRNPRLGEDIERR